MADRIAKKRTLYVANQVSQEGFDEIQQLYMAYLFRCPMALDGPPGTGKTQSILEMARVLGKELFTKSCSERTTESHIISYPVLVEQAGASVTNYRNGPLCMAMQKGGIFYGDEFNQLKGDLQKRMNSAFDSRREIDRNDGARIAAHDDFWATISYNPSETSYTRDLDGSVADRFIHLSYGRWNSNFKAYIAASAAASAFPGKKVKPMTFGLKLEGRGISVKNATFSVCRDSAWYDFFDPDTEVAAPDYPYLVYDPGSILSGRSKVTCQKIRYLSESCAAETDFPKELSSFSDAVCTMGRTGCSELIQKLGLSAVLKDECLDLLEVHECSTRIESAALKHYLFLRDRGCPAYLAQAYAVRMVINQLCHGQHRNQVLSKATCHEIVTAVASAMGLLLSQKAFNTQLAKPA